MKNILHTIQLFTGFLLFANLLIAQQQPTETKITGFGRINFAELAKKELVAPPKIRTPRFIPLRERPSKLPIPPKDSKVTSINTPFESDISQPEALAPSPSPTRSFTGLLDNNQVIPPDVNGAAGTTYLMETLNSQYRIFKKNGGVVSTIDPSTFWSVLGDFEGDPHIVFDNGRWITSCIGFLSATNHYAIFVAVSLTDDPTGSWYLYSIDTGPTSTLPDYPLLGYNKKWVVITTNDFRPFFARVRIVVLNKAKLKAGTLGTVHTFFDASGIFTLSPAETQDATQGTEYMLTDYNGNAGGFGYVQVCTITGKAGNPVYTAGAVIGVNKPWSESGADAPQLGSTRRIDAGGTRMRTVMVRNGFIWATHAVWLPATNPNRMTTQYWQINPATNAVPQFGRIADNNSDHFYAYPSLAVTPQNDVLIGFSRFSPTIYASAAYAYRNHSDAPNILRGTVTFKAGEASYYKDYNSGRNRWGDFSATCIDPADNTFWTLQEFADSPANEWGTWWANVGAATLPVPVANAATNAISHNVKTQFTISPNPAKEMITLKWQSVKATDALLTITNVQGNVILAQKLQAVSGGNQRNIPLGSLNNGTYIVSLRMNNDILTSKLIIQK